MENNEIHPDADFYRNGFQVRAFGDTRAQEFFNIFATLAGSDIRYRTVFYNDRVVVVILCNQKEAEIVVDRLEIGEDGYYYLPT